MRSSGFGIVLCVLWAAAAASAGPTGDLNALLKGVELHYNHAKTLSVEFRETYSVAGHERRPEAGTVVLKKPGKMRWTYRVPDGKLFISNGKEVYLYTSSDNRVERSNLKATEDLRAPLAFLLGHLDLNKEFKDWESNAAEGGTYLMGRSQKENSPYARVGMLVKKGTFEITRLRVEGQDGTTLGFEFSNEVTNLPLQDKLFLFTIPSGAEVVDAVTDGSGGR